MTRTTSAHSPVRKSSRGPNFLASLITCSAVTFLYFNFDPEPVGADAAGTASNISELTARISAPPPPMPILANSATESTNGEAADNDSGEGVESAAHSIPSNPDVLQGRMAILLNMLLIEKGSQQLEKIPTYTTMFYKQERIGGTLSDGQVMEMKVRHAPFSVYMKWLSGDKGRELLYVDGANAGDMIVHPGGWKARLLPAIKLNPTGAVAMSEARHPITKAGLLELARTNTLVRKWDLQNLDKHRCFMVAGQKFNDRECYYFEIEYASPEISDVYRKSEVYIDAELALPVFCRQYTWPSDADKDLTKEQIDEKTLIEHYTYTDIQLDRSLADADFDQTNKAYRFRR